MTMTTSLDWFPFYARDFWGSFRVEALDFEAVGLLLFLISREWESGPLPGDEDLLRRMVAGRVKDWAAAWAQVKPFFEPAPDDRLVNPRLEREREEAETRIDQQRAAGRRGGLRSAIAKQASGEPRTSDETGSSEPQPPTGPDRTEQNPTSENSQPAAAAANSDASKTPRRRTRPANGPHAEFIEFWMTNFHETKGTSYAFRAGRDGAHVKAILEMAGGDLARAQQVALALLSSNESFYVDKGVDLGLLCSQWNRISSAGRASKTASTRPRGAAYQKFVPPMDGDPS